MAKTDKIQNELNAVTQLSEITKMLEETAARDIAQLRVRVVNSRPYFREAWKIYDILQQLSPPAPDVMNKQLVVAITLDWGMTGSLLRRVTETAEELYQRYEADLLLTGKMGKDRFTNRDERTIHFFDVPKKATYADIEPVYKVIAGYARLHIVYPQFESLSKQTVKVVTLASDQLKKSEGKIAAERFVVEPDIKAVSNYVNEMTVGLIIYNYFSEALLAYSAAQMVAMRASNDHAKEETRHLNVRFNKARREQIDAKLRELYAFNFSRNASGRNT